MTENNVVQVDEFRIRVRHFPEHRLTVVLEVYPQKVRIAASVAGAKDHWSRKLGYMIAKGRMDSKKEYVRGRYTLHKPVPVTGEKNDVDWNKLFELLAMRMAGGPYQDHILQALANVKQ